MLGGERERKVREDKWMEGEMDIGKRGVVKRRCDVGVDDGLGEKDIEGMKDRGGERRTRGEGIRRWKEKKRGPEEK